MDRRLNFAQILFLFTYLRTIENLWGFFVEDDGLAVDVSSQAPGHAHDEDEDAVAGHRGRFFVPGALPTTPMHSLLYARPSNSESERSRPGRRRRRWAGAGESRSAQSTTYATIQIARGFV